MTSKIFATVPIACAMLAAAPASATITIDYFKVSANGRDFEGTAPYSSVTNGIATTLGPNGRPVVTAANPLQALDYNNATRELLWWTPQSTSNLTVVSDGSRTIASNSFSDGSFYPSQGNGSSNADGFQTAIFSGSFDIATARNVIFTLGSDDDAFLFVDGVAVVQNGGIHINTVQANSVALGVGSHTFQLFYADRRTSLASLTFSLPDDIIVTPTAGVPEPSTWAMMIAGFGMVGAATRRRPRVTARLTVAG